MCPWLSRRRQESINYKLVRELGLEDQGALQEWIRLDHTQYRHELQLVTPLIEKQGSNTSQPVSADFNHNMVLTTEERVWLVKHVFREGGRYTDVVRQRFAEKFPDKPVPHRNAVCNLVKFRETGSVDDAERCGRPAKLSEEKLLNISDKDDEGRFGGILVNYRQIEEITSVLNAGRLQMRHEKSGAPTYQPAAELSGTQFEIASGAQFENVVEPNRI
ncbi:hypothetical protein E2C01_012247 [Portunus trituberculatus]|uniref:Uncharacterized protein n=1 Tax=Portunus trituberculatus TaxID=210409 RepID=A0A5B7DDJ5_PORTR|nr:hypothetical protein [Portunus trituberculatus]